MAISPASAANYDWFLDTLCRRDQEAAIEGGASIHETLAHEIDAALLRPSTILFHPYLFGSPHGNAASGSFLGLHGWHDRGDMLKAVLEGIAFNHKSHIDALRNGFAFRQARLTGGASRNPAFAQMFADILGMPVMVTSTDEAAAFGAALCAGAAVGLFASVQDDPRDLNATAHTYLPDPARSAEYSRRFSLYCRMSETLKPIWPDIEKLAETNEGGSA
jgi:L-xylulokinase